MHGYSLFGFLLDLFGVEDRVRDVGDVAHDDTQRDRRRQQPEAQHQTHQDLQL